MGFPKNKSFIIQFIQVILMRRYYVYLYNLQILFETFFVMVNV